MSELLRRRLRQSLLARYEQLRTRLERVLGSPEDAADALQETWVRIEGISSASVVHNDDAYLWRMANNIAVDAHHKRYKLLTTVELDDLVHIVDEGADTLQQVAAKLEMQQLLAMLQDMPERPRLVLLAARVDGLSYAQIAQQHNMSTALVNKEMCRALAYLRKQLASRLNN
ncbi:RNA polymerase sigma factor [Alcaligenes endophyticus]|uniref:Sigma-70 family RNA polymerase sigma factor n=1 Tax=Alcaligenes endophyticus TaxID=1929088 RepID=A0ABT8EHB3_9BURK|nr:sigma-70 family RNA polymerase sigma factor [Alcaligenes endophyticus]MCX5589749.1 sigma-70 family RNA polymerase sigma factor [Alcaligenes endophyticus]MDN4120587.1 sigma-70 family RNA polymerase sigma factor [Alcaligenes endophyticus]